MNVAVEIITSHIVGDEVGFKIGCIAPNDRIRESQAQSDDKGNEESHNAAGANRGQAMQEAYKKTYNHKKVQQGQHRISIVDRIQIPAQALQALQD